MSRNIFQQAMDVQDASNPVAVMGLLEQIRQHIIENDPEYRTQGHPYFAKHPALVLVMNKLTSMMDVDRGFGKAYEQCDFLASAGATTAVVPPPFSTGQNVKHGERVGVIVNRETINPYNYLVEFPDGERVELKYRDVKLARTYRCADGSTPTLTDKQIEALDKVATRFNLGDKVDVSPEILGSAVFVNAGGMVLGIEADGYTHS